MRNHDRAAQRKPVIILPLRVADMLTLLQTVARAGVGERSTRVESLVHEIIVRASMQLIAARLHRVVEVAAAYLAVLRRKVAGLNRDFLDRVQAGLIDLILL